MKVNPKKGQNKEKTLDCNLQINLILLLENLAPKDGQQTKDAILETVVNILVIAAIK
jgi:hypothetical protein